MSPLRFHRSIYSPTALAQAMAVFEEHGELERRDQDPYVLVEVCAGDAASTELLAGEFCNYVLALTVEESRAST